MSGASANGAGHRSLADQLRGWPEERLTRLLRARPDLATPAPQDSSQLASRAATRASLARALDRLSHLELAVLDAVVVVGPATDDEVVAAVAAEPAATTTALERLADLALVWHSTGGVRALTGVAAALAPGSPGASGIRPRSEPPLASDRVADQVAGLSEAARRMLDHVDAHGGQATTGAARRHVAPEEASSPAEELLARRLLVPRDDGLVVLPGEVALALRGGRTTREPVDDVPALATSARTASLVDRAAAGAASELVHRVELLLDHWGLEPPAELRSGGLSVRDLKAVAALLHSTERVAALLVELVAEAGLLAARADAAGDPVRVPTDAYDAWLAGDPERRWLALVTAWLRTVRDPALVGTRDVAGKGRNALSPDLTSPTVAESRRMALEALAELPAGEVLASGTGVPSLVARVSWQRPRRPASRSAEVASAVEESAVLGVTGLGGLAGHGRALLSGDDDAAVAALAVLLPSPVSQVVLQADLTAVAPGPLESTVGRRLHLLADVESRGGATVYRFTAGSLRRALDQGWSAHEVHAFLDEVAATEVPQPLRYLVDDTARTFGSVRAGHAESYLRADDETVLAGLLHHPKAAPLRLRRLAPTVVTSELPLEVLLPRLRDLGAAPVVEAADGSVHVARPDQLRARTPRGRRLGGAVEAREAAQAAQVAAAIRAGDQVAASRPAGAVETLTPGGSLAALREAVDAGEPVLIGYVDNHGTRTERLVHPTAVEGGQLAAYDVRSEDRRRFAVHRITSVRPAGPPPRT